MSGWIEHAVTYVNRSGRSIWVAGYLETHPFAGIETRDPRSLEWSDYGLAYCGTGARAIEIEADASYAFTVSLPATYVGRDFRVTLEYRTAEGSNQWFIAASQARRLQHSVAGQAAAAVEEQRTR